MNAEDIVPVQAEVATQEAVTTPTSKTLMVTSKIRELIVHLVPVLLGGRVHHLLYKSMIGHQ